MKKVVFIFGAFLLFFSSITFAQSRRTPPQAPQKKSSTHGTVDFELKQGENSVPIPQGSVKFFIDGAGMVTTVKYLDLLGRPIEMKPDAASTNGASIPDCENNVPGLCFATADKAVSICMCNPNGRTKGQSLRMNWAVK